MGFSISWLAVQGKSAHLTHQHMGFAPTGEYTDYGLAPVVGRFLPSDWYVIVAKGCDHKIVSAPILKEVSACCAVVACSIEEHVMYSSAAYWNNGTMQWAVRHRGGDSGAMDLMHEGFPPPIFDELRARFFSLQEAEGGERAGVDWIFEIPLELAKSYVGFKHDEETQGVEEESFEILQPIRSGFDAEVSKPWWRLW